MERGGDRSIRDLEEDVRKINEKLDRLTQLFIQNMSGASRASSANAQEDGEIRDRFKHR